MIHACIHCGQKNRVPPAHLADTGRCGACKAPMGPSGVPIDVDPAEFRQIIHAVAVPVLVDFWAAWCGPCRLAAPEVQRVAHELRGQALVLKVDTERHPGLAQQFQVRGIPTFAVFRGGRIVHRQAGLVDHRQMQQWLLEAGAGAARMHAAN